MPGSIMKNHNPRFRLSRTAGAIAMLALRLGDGRTSGLIGLVAGVSARAGAPPERSIPNAASATTTVRCRR